MAVILLSVAFAIGFAPPHAEFTGSVISITDGDTITVLQDQTPIKVRLEGIDAPEAKQAFGSKAREALKEMCPINSTVTVEQTGTDRYGRTLGVVLVDGVSINAKMVQDGWAWHFVKYSDDETLAALEQEARAERRGLWKDDNPLPPWEFRARKAPKPAAQATYWLNTSSGVRHNQTCEHFDNTKRGRICGPDEGRPCKECGG